MIFLYECINMRFYVLFLRVDRVCVKDTVLKGVKIEKGVAVNMPIWYIHRNPEIWEDPETFNPERLGILLLF